MTNCSFCKNTIPSGATLYKCDGNKDGVCPNNHEALCELCACWFRYNVEAKHCEDCWNTLYFHCDCCDEDYERPEDEDDQPPECFFCDHTSLCDGCLVVGSTAVFCTDCLEDHPLCQGCQEFLTWEDNGHKGYQSNGLSGLCETCCTIEEAKQKAAQVKLNG